MTQPRRLHIEGGIYYIHQPAHPSQPIIVDDEDCNTFFEVMGPILESGGGRLHAYAISAEGFHLALQIKKKSTSTIMNVFKTQYSRKFNRAHRIKGENLGLRYSALLIDPYTYLLALINYIHSQPCIRSSHAAYLGEAHPSWLVTTVAAAMLAPRKEKVPRAYQELSERPPSAEEIEYFQNGSRQDPRVLGNVTFLHKLRNVVPYRSALTLNDVIRSVALQRGVDVTDMASRLRTDNLVLARALVLWHATERRIATLTEVANSFGRRPSTMKESLDAQRKSHPDLFSAMLLDLARPLTLNRQSILTTARAFEPELDELLIAS